jgi:hypothetical protein
MRLGDFENVKKGVDMSSITKIAIVGRICTNRESRAKKTPKG